MSSPQPLIQRFDHLGLICAFCAEITLVGMIDSLAPKQSEHAVSHAEVMLTMILNGLGFHSRTLRPEFLTSAIFLKNPKRIYPRHLKMHVGGKRVKPLSIEVLCDWAE